MLPFSTWHVSPVAAACVAHASQGKNVGTAEMHHKGFSTQQTLPLESSASLNSVHIRSRSRQCWSRLVAEAFLHI